MIALGVVVAWAPFAYTEQLDVAAADKAATADDASAPARLIVVAEAKTPNQRAGTGEPVCADVLVDGVLVGTTPFTREVSTGFHDVRVEYLDEKILERSFQFMSGADVLVEAAVVRRIPVDERGAVVANDWHVYETKRLRLQREWNAEMRAYRGLVDQREAERKPNLLAGWLLAAGGVGLATTGIIFLAFSAREHDKYNAHYDEWLEESDPEQMKVEKKEAEEARDTRNLNRGLGIGFLVLGTAAVTTGIVLWVRMPRKPEEPTQPPGFVFTEYPDLKLLPTFGTSSAGLVLEGRF
jgi:hypothetical protein